MFVDNVCCCLLGQVTLENEITIATGFIIWLNKINKKDAVTCEEEEEEPGLCVSGLRDLSKAGGLMRRVASPPCRGCTGVGRSSFSNTEENSSLSTCREETGRNTRLMFSVTITPDA